MPDVKQLSQPLLPPGQLWPTPTRPAQGGTKPTPAVTSPTTLPALPSLPQLPPQGQSMPLVTFTSPPGLGGQLTQLKDMIKNADDRLLDFYNVKLVKDGSGKISGYQLNGRNVSSAEVQQHLLPRSGVLHKQITDLKADINRTYAQFKLQVQQQFPALAPTEQNSVNIQLQAVHVVYEGFVNRLNQIDDLIK